MVQIKSLMAYTVLKLCQLPGVCLTFISGFLGVVGSLFNKAGKKMHHLVLKQQSREIAMNPFKIVLYYQISSVMW